MQVGRETARCARGPTPPSYPGLIRRMEVPMLFGLMLIAAVDSSQVRNIPVALAETLRATVTGSGQTVVIIPGLLGSSYAYRKVVPSLAAAGVRTVVVEALGVGFSSRPSK